MGFMTLAFSEKRDLGLVICFIVIGLICGSILLCWILWHRIVLVLFAVLFLVLGLVLPLLCSCALEHNRDVLLKESQSSSQESSWYFVRIVDDPIQSLYGYSATAEIKALSDAQNLFVPSYRIRLYFDEMATHCFGEEFAAQLLLSMPSERSLDSCNKKGIVLTASLKHEKSFQSSTLGLFSQLRINFQSHLDDKAAFYSLDEETVAFLKALIVGDRSGLYDTALYQAVKTTGLAHLVAVSGAHLVIVLGFVRIFLDALRLPRRVAFVMQIAFLVLYLIMVGFPLSCLRAALMMTLSLMAFSRARRSSALSALSIVVILFIAIDPNVSLSLSFALSVLATFGIIVFMPLLSQWFSFSHRKLRTWVSDPVCMTLAALLPTFPLSMATFAQFPLIVPLSNMLAVPCITFICGIGTLAFVSMNIPLLGDLILFGAYGGAVVITALINAMAGIPGGALPVDVSLSGCVVLSAGVMIALWLLWPVRFRGLSVVVVSVLFVFTVACSSLFPRLDTEVVMLDVGQGDAFLVRSEGRTILIDTGNQTTKLYAALARQGVNRLDAIIISHADDDHCGALNSLRGIVSCDQVMFAAGMGDLGTDKGNELVSDAELLVGEAGITELCKGDMFSVGALEFRVIHPQSLRDEGGNDDSICLLMTSDINHDGIEEWNALFCGDAEADILESLVDSGELSELDIYKVGHHGSKAALNKELIEKLSPSIALVSVGADNSYGHPHATTLELLASIDAHIFRSDEQGDVVCSLTMENITVLPMH